MAEIANQPAPRSTALPTIGELRRLALRLGPSGGPLLERPPARLPAGGTEPTGLRDYAPGDDPRQIDWTICARRDEVLTRVYEGRVPSRIDLLLDCSASMDWPTAAEAPSSSDLPEGSRRTTKWDLARRIAALLSCAALTTDEALTITAFADRLGKRLAGLRGTGQLERAVRFLGTLGPTQEGTRLDSVAEQLVRRRVRPGVVVVLSDLLDPSGFAGAIDRLRYYGYLPRIVQVYDPSEADPRLLGEAELRDVESGGSLPAMVTESVAVAYRRRFARLLYDVRAYGGRWGLPWAQFSTTASDDELVRTLLGVTRAPWPTTRCREPRPSGRG
jgi:uncharacterized protein (DUF58 family)